MEMTMGQILFWITYLYLLDEISTVENVFIFMFYLVFIIAYPLMNLKIKNHPYL